VGTEPGDDEGDVPNPMNLVGMVIMVRILKEKAGRSACLPGGSPTAQSDANDCFPDTCPAPCFYWKI